MSHMSPATQAKGRGLVESGRVTIAAQREGFVDALVKGTAPDPYSVMLLDGKWSCTCRARVTCSHIIAAQAASGQR